MATNGKREQVFRYRITGTIALGGATTLAAAQRHVASLAAVARGLGTAQARFSVPRLTNVEMTDESDEPTSDA